MSEEALQNEEIQEEVLATEESVETTEPATEETENTEEEHKQSRSQDRKYRQKRLLQESQAREAQLQSQLSDLSTKVDTLINPPAERPSRVDFESEEEYEDALFDFRTPVAPAPVETQTQAQPQQFVDHEAEENWEDSLERGAKKYGDFQEVISNPNVNYSAPMVDAVKSNDNAAEIAYFLGKNPQEADKMVRMSPVDQIRAIDKLGNTFKSTTTNAPSPITPTKSGDSTGSKSLEDMSPSEYAEHRRTSGMGR